LPPGGCQSALPLSWEAMKELGCLYLEKVELRINQRCDVRAMLGSLLWVLVVVATPALPARGIRVAEAQR
jgi:hypothetical protein